MIIGIIVALVNNSQKNNSTKKHSNSQNNPNSCSICGSSAGYWSGCIKVSDGRMCKFCLNRAKTSKYELTVAGILNQMTVQNKSSRIAKFEESSKYYSLNKPNLSLGKSFSFFDKDKKLAIYYSSRRIEVFDYKNIVDIDLIENNQQVVSGGLKSAAVGGLLGGATGAIIGSNIQNKKVNLKVTSRKIKIRLKNEYTDIISVDVLHYNSGVVDQIIYKILSIIDKSIFQLQDHSSASSDAEEIIKMNELFEKGIITEEEFKILKAKIINRQ